MEKLLKIFDEIEAHQTAIYNLATKAKKLVLSGGVSTPPPAQRGIGSSVVAKRNANLVKPKR